MELLPESIDLLHPDHSHPLQKMLAQGAIWVVERQIRSTKFKKVISSTGNIVDVNDCTTNIAKNDHAIATAFAHWSWASSQGRVMFLDIQGFAGQFVDVETITASQSEHLFAEGNLGEPSIEHYFQEHECNFLCHRLGIDESRPGRFLSSLTHSSSKISIGTVHNFTGLELSSLL